VLCSCVCLAGRSRGRGRRHFERACIGRALLGEIERTTQTAPGFATGRRRRFRGVRGVLRGGLLGRGAARLERGLGSPEILCGLRNLGTHTPQRRACLPFSFAQVLHLHLERLGRGCLPPQLT
jgi:hypothetical protein